MTTARRSPKALPIESLKLAWQDYVTSERIVVESVKIARWAGCTWEEIAVATGAASKQAAFDKWAKRIGSGDDGRDR